MAFYAVMIPLSFVSSWARVPLLTVTAAYIGLGLALAGGGLRGFDRFNILKACFILHCGYGYGYWLGIWDFVINSNPPRVSMQGQTT
ncbi:MAG: hypothetical protein HC902_02565 [Calothrix sp. SM1_5_4]|nr:hypothetical protein [Calothrix sp. SM1_5_4]